MKIFSYYTPGSIALIGAIFTAIKTMKEEFKFFEREK